MLVDFVQFCCVSLLACLLACLLCCVVLAKNVVLSQKLRIEWPRTIVTDALDVYGKL